MANTDDNKPKLALVDDAFDDVEDEYGDPEYEYDRACKAQQEKNDASDDYFGGSFDQELFSSVYNELARGLGLDDALGFPPVGGEDDAYADDEDLPTREEAISMLALALFYLTSREGKDSNGKSVLRASKSVERQVLARMRDAGFINCNDKEESVTITTLGEEVGEECVAALGFDYLLDNLQLVD